MMKSQDHFKTSQSKLNTLHVSDINKWEMVVLAQQYFDFPFKRQSSLFIGNIERKTFDPNCHPICLIIMSSLASKGRHFIRCCIRERKIYTKTVRCISDKRIGMLGIPFNKGQVRKLIICKKKKKINLVFFKGTLY